MAKTADERAAEKKAKDEWKKEHPYVSFRLGLDVKARVEKAAAEHNRTQSEQMAISLEDGLMLQAMIAAVSDHLKGKKKTHYFKMANKPSVEECLVFIDKAVHDAIEDDQ